MDYVFLMCSVEDSRIVEIAGVRTNPRITPLTKRSILAAFTTETENFRDAYSKFKQALVAPFDHRCIVVTHTLETQRPILRAECERISQEELFYGRAWIDLAQLAWPLVLSGMLASRSIDTLAHYFKVEHKADGDCADTCTAMAQIFANMMRRYKTALAGEDMIRGFGGETLEELRKMMGF